jgi:hypothetical protein
MALPDSGRATTPSTYAGYMIDLDGHNLEAVFHGRESSPPLPESTL